MPQKRNPHLCQDIIASAAEVRGVVPLALESLQMEHESDRGMSLILIGASERACIAMGDALSGLVSLLGGLMLFPERMRRNLDLTGGLIMGEHVMMVLGETLGRQKAHDAVYDVAQAAGTSGASFAALLADDPRVSGRLGPEEIDRMLDPQNYLGLSAELARDAASRARRHYAARHTTPTPSDP
jgi:3-carboxy-cis,cis-muconate cycloisomerase